MVEWSILEWVIFIMGWQVAIILIIYRLMQRHK